MTSLGAKGSGDMYLVVSGCALVKDERGPRFGRCAGLCLFCEC